MQGFLPFGHRQTLFCSYISTVRSNNARWILHIVVLLGEHLYSQTLPSLHRILTLSHLLHRPNLQVLFVHSFFRPTVGSSVKSSTLLNICETESEWMDEYCAIFSFICTYNSWRGVERNFKRSCEVWSNIKEQELRVASTTIKDKIICRGYFAPTNVSSQMSVFRAAILSSVCTYNTHISITISWHDL